MTVAGHSHRGAFWAGRTLLPPELQERTAIFTHTSEHSLADTDYWRSVAYSTDYLGVVWNGNQAAATFTVPADPITVVGRRGRVAPPVGQVVPYALLVDYWSASLDDLRWFLTTRTDLRSVILLGTPPPKPDDLIRGGMQHEPHFRAALEGAGLTADTAPITDIESRVALWESLQDAMERAASESGVRFLPVPATTQAPDGSLLPELSTVDATHANLQYGRIYWEHLLTTVESW